VPVKQTSFHLPFLVCQNCPFINTFLSFFSAPSLIPLSSDFHSNNRVADVGPGDTGHEMHAKMEEAIEHALAIINGAAKFADEAQLEQVEPIKTI
jgi:hypothetical protein